ncbi:LuxR C-terminal-related transcriptional regulator [Aromatoleum evansii]|uniref:LuxR C-terminal-related transcriptional regulator n=1 Tax=Aromatoleum evansii TaxID=59406 RepID=UPI00145EA9DF|nr:DNA-binding response regulator [Aromatoleum evansii]
MTAHRKDGGEPFGAHARESEGAARCDAGREIGQIELAGRTCRVVLVDGLIPGHLTTGGAKGVRLTYVDGEIAHFEFEGHRYAVVADPAGRPGVGPSAEALAHAAPDIARVLTSRELQIVQLLCMGYLTKQVADRLRISEFTVRSYLKTVYAKLGVRSRAALVFRYMKTFNGGNERLE